MSDSLSRATGKVYRRAWRQALFALPGLPRGAGGPGSGDHRGRGRRAGGLLPQLPLDGAAEPGHHAGVLGPLLPGAVAGGPIEPGRRRGYHGDDAWRRGTRGCLRSSASPRGSLTAIGSALASAWLAPTFALGADGVYAWKMLLGLLPALRRRFAPGGALVTPRPHRLLPSLGPGRRRPAGDRESGPGYRPSGASRWTWCSPWPTACSWTTCRRQVRVVDLGRPRVLIGGFVPLIALPPPRAAPGAGLVDEPRQLLALWAARLAGRARR